MSVFLVLFTLLLAGCEKKEISVAAPNPNQITNDITAKSTVAKPNILLIIADDMGVDATPGYSIGATKPNMPNLQNLATNGLTFDNAWAYPKCSPTRASMLTGKYGFHTGVLNVGNHVSLTEKSIQTYLDDNSTTYSHSIIGKWHLSNGLNDAEVMGVDYYAGYSGGAVSDYYNWNLVENGQSSSTTEYCTSKLTDLAISWINQQSQPWFCWLAYSAPHTPYHLPPTNMHSQGNLPTDQASINANPMPYYMAMIESIDHEIGRIQDSIPTSVMDDTVIIFIGDNGTPKKVLQSPYASTQGKGSLFRGGVNVPLIVSGNGVTRINERDQSMIASTDLFATIAEIAGVNQSTYENSVSFKSVLSTSNTFPRDHNYSELTDASKPAKSGYTIADDLYKVIQLDNGVQKFYDLSTDPYESNNIKTRNQTPAQKSAKNALLSEASLIRQ
ncbi:sulfatase-like hydrolase/transferase [Aquimarina sp. 2201CG1-2-11]|uniref:sulfatase-like hydrolase/transferase n=1 Tax=Aquimarina discodermiae TaxID=3231043 RepID=UPI003463838C